MSVSEFDPSTGLAPTTGRAPLRAATLGDPQRLRVLRPTEETGVNLLEYWQALVKHRVAIGVVFVVALVVGALVTLLIPPVYTASATIQIDRDAPKVMNVQQVDESPDLFSSEEFYQTQYGLLRSKSLADRMVKTLGLDSNRTFLTGGHSSVLALLGAPIGLSMPSSQGAAQKKAVKIFRHNLGIDPVRGSHLVKISYSNANPVLAAQIANSTAENFITANLERRYEASSYARDFLQNRLGQVKAKLEESEKQLADYATAQHIINLPGPTGVGSEVTQSPTANSLVSLNTALSDATAQRIKAEQEWRQAQSTPGTDLPQALASPTIQALIQARASLQATYQDKLNLYRPEFPTMVQMHAQIAELDRQINTQTGAIKQALKAQYQTALNQERQLGGQVNGLKSDMLSLNDRSIQYNILQREVDTNRTLYDGLLQRYKEIGVTGGIGVNNISVVDRADPPDQPSQPKPLTNLALAAVAGLILGCIVAFILEALDQSIRTPQDVEEKLALPLLGAVPLLGKEEAPSAALADLKSAFSEAYYSIRTSLQFTTGDGVPGALFVTSCQPSEGKSTTAQALAQNFARIGARVLLVDADLRNPSIHRHFPVDNSVGLSSFLAGACSLKDAAQPSGIANLSITPCGPLPPSPAELLAGEKLRAFLAAARTEFDIVIVDGPPIMGLADAPILASATEGTVLIVEAGRTRRGAARAAIRRLQAANGRVLGIVLTKFNAKRATYGYGYDYAYGHDYGGRSVAKT
ncbi:GumC family protein [Caulobacter sp. KR2-114]|uniref:GumC family protein n=1 Tax=Caulobacter sp. KR2-114 TaxID=3400912 RepID=UPI003C09F781